MGTGAPWRNRIVGEGDEAPDQLLANPWNARVHPHSQEQALLGVLDQVGVVQRVIVNRRSGHLVDGHLRVAAALSRAEPSVPVVYVDLAEDEEKLVLATLDPLGALAGYDAGVLDDLLRDVQADSSAVQALLEDLAARHPPAANGALPGGDPDALPTMPATPTTTPGDLVALGRHRLLCGDSAARTDVERLMDGATPGMIWTDPPYGMHLDTDYARLRSGLRFARDRPAWGGRAYPPVAGDAGPFDPSFLMALFASCPEQFWFGADYYAERIAQRSDGAWIVWDKRLDEEADRMYGSCFELCWSKAPHQRAIARVKWAGVFGLEQEPDRKRHHPTQKPVALGEWFVTRYSPERALIADFYAGSGTLLLAAERTGRTAYLMESDPQYCDVIVQRWETLTGQQAQRLSAGQTDRP